MIFSGYFAFALPAVLFLLLWGFFYFVLAPLGRWPQSHASDRSAGNRLILKSARLPVFLAIGAGIAGGAFLYLAEQFGRSTSLVYHDDRAVNAWFPMERSPELTILLRAVAAAASPVGLWVLIAVVAAVFFVRKQRSSAIFLVIATGAGGLLDVALKHFFARARPLAAIAAARGYSFPSGHAMDSFMVFGAIAYLLTRQPIRWNIKSACLALLTSDLLLVAWSRVYLGVHWISDVAAGWCAGAMWLLAAIAAFETLLRHKHGGYPGESQTNI